MTGLCDSECAAGWMGHQCDIRTYFFKNSLLFFYIQNKMTGNTYQDGACIFQIIRLLDTIDTRSVFIQYASRLEKNSFKNII